MMKPSIVTLILILTLTVGVSAGQTISLHVEDRPTTVNVHLYDSTSYVPLRAVVNILLPEAATSWEHHAAVVTAPRLRLVAAPGSCYIEANNRLLYVKGSVLLIQGKTYVPVRTLAKALGATVTWDGSTSKVSLYRGSDPILSGDLYYNPHDLYWLSRIINAESNGEPFLGQIAVGNVVLNRVKSPAFPDGIYDVIFDTKWGVQFEPVRNGTIHHTPSEESIRAAKLCLDGASVVGSSIYFLNPAKASSFWSMQNGTYVATIGNHLFYAE